MDAWRLLAGIELLFMGIFGISLPFGLYHFFLLFFSIITVILVLNT